MVIRRIMRAFGKRRTGYPEILVVEDDRDLQELLKTYLEQVECRLVFTETMKDAEAMISGSAADPGKTYRLLVLDYRLPDGNGLQLLKNVRKTSGYKQVPVILISGDLLPSRMEEIRSRFEQVSVMRKPLNMRDFKRKVMEALGEPKTVYQ